MPHQLNQFFHSSLHGPGFRSNLNFFLYLSLVFLEFEQSSPENMSVKKKKKKASISSWLSSATDSCTCNSNSERHFAFFIFPHAIKRVFTFTWVYGEMKLVMHTKPASANSLATSAIRRTFSSLSSGVKPRFLLRPWRILSPSNV